MKFPVFFFTLLVSAFTATAAYAQGVEPPMPPPADEGFTQMLIMLSIALAFFYLILWRPEQKRRKALEDQRSGLKKGDEVLAMGILGTVHKIDEETVILKMVDGAKIRMLRGAITEVRGHATDGDKDTDTESDSKRVDLAKHQK